MRWLRYALPLLLAAYLLTGVTQIRPGERAVVRRFGRVLDHQPEPGLWIGLPWGMDRVDRVAMDLVRRVEVGYLPDDVEDGLSTPPGQLLTGDHNLVNIRIVLNYTVDPDQVVDYVLQADRADNLTARAAEAGMAEWLAGRSVDEVLLHGKIDLPRWLVARTQERLQSYHLGVRIRDAQVAHLLPPIEVKGDFDQVTQAQTEIRMRRNQAEQRAESQIRAAQGERYSREQLALAYADQQRRLARAEAEVFQKRLRQYHQLRQNNPDILTAIWWDEMGKLLARLRENGRVDLLDHYLGADGLDVTTVAPPPKK